MTALPRIDAPASDPRVWIVGGLALACFARRIAGWKICNYPHGGITVC